MGRGPCRFTLPIRVLIPIRPGPLSDPDSGADSQVVSVAIPARWGGFSRSRSAVVGLRGFLPCFARGGGETLHP